MTSNQTLLNQTFVLCIEPDGEICLLLSKILDHGLSIQRVARVEEAAHFLREQHPALIVIENTFPEHDVGLRVAAIKEMAPTAKYS